MRIEQTMRDIEVLQHWGLHVLRQGSHAAPADLREIIRLRARADLEVPECLERSEPEPFLALLPADRDCVRYCGTLLYLTEEEAHEAAASVGGNLNPGSWLGIHLWELTQTVPGWATKLGDPHPAEIVNAFHDLRNLMGGEWTDREFITEAGDFRLDLADVGQRWISFMLLQNRWRAEAGPTGSRAPRRRGAGRGRRGPGGAAPATPSDRGLRGEREN